MDLGGSVYLILLISKINTMQKQTVQFSYQVFASVDALEISDQTLFAQAQKALALAHAPYSKFKVGAAAILQNGEIIKGSNQENASYPIGICAERVLLSTASTLQSKVPIVTIAITYHNERGGNNIPIAPCGMCRQAIAEYESIVDQSIRLILGGETGEIYVIEKAADLLPFGFSGVHLQ
jgi:cytidine deaminase